MNAAGWPEGVERVLATLEAAGHPAYVVGGSVRDKLLQRPVHDYDMTTDATPDQVQQLFPHTIATGVQHGTVTVVMDDMTMEVTTYRIDLNYTDGRRPDDVEFTDRLDLDLMRRDFTINAMAMDRAGRLIDPLGGQQDLAAGSIRAVGDAATRFQEDGLRILRALRLAAQFQFIIEPRTLAGMQSQSARLQNVSAERVGQEFIRLASADWWTLTGLLAQGPWLSMLPEPWPAIQAAMGTLAAHPDAAPAWHEHVASAWPTSSIPMASLATWCHLASMSPDSCRQLARKMAWSSATGRRLAHTITYAAVDPLTWDAGRWRHELHEADAEALDLACALLDWLDTMRYGPCSQRVATLHSQASAHPLRWRRDLAIDGRTLLGLGYQGPAVGQELNRLVEAVLLGDVVNARAALRERARMDNEEASR